MLFVKLLSWKTWMCRHWCQTNFWVNIVLQPYIGFDELAYGCWNNYCHGHVNFFSHVNIQNSNFINLTIKINPKSWSVLANIFISLSLPMLQTKLVFLSADLHTVMIFSQSGPELSIVFFYAKEGYVIQKEKILSRA